MALDFTAASDRVSIAADASINNLSAFTCLIWFYTDSSASDAQVYFRKGENPSRVTLERLSGDADDFEGQVRHATTHATTRTTGVNKPINTHFFTAMTFGDAQATNRIRIYTATLGNIVVEASYSTQTDGVGSQNDDSSYPLILGNQSNFNERLLGRMAFYHLVSSELTLSEIIEQQYHPHVRSDSQVFMHLGFNGTGTQPDWSGNGNSGTVTGTVVADHVPLGPPFGFDTALPYVVAAVGGLDILIAAYHHFHHNLT